MLRDSHDTLTLGLGGEEGGLGVEDRGEEGMTRVARAQGEEMAERQNSLNSSLAYPTPFLPPMVLASRHQEK